MTERTRLFLRYQLPVFLWAGIIILLSSIPHPPNVNELMPGLDKAAHFFEYGILGFLLTRSLYYHRRDTVRARAGVISLILGLVFAGSDEFHQIFIPDRIPSLYDFAADALGIIMAQVVFYVRVKKQEKNTTK